MRAYCWLYRAFLCLFAISDMAVFMTHLEKNRPGFGIEREFDIRIEIIYLKIRNIAIKALNLWCQI